MDPTVHIRRATALDIPALHDLIDASVRVLQAGDYSPEQIEGALGTVFGVDTSLIEDGTCFLAEAGAGARTPSSTLPSTPPASAPSSSTSFARRGIGSCILDTCEQDAACAGFRRFELGATAAGERLCRVRGYVEIDRIEAPLPNGVSLAVIRMAKRI